MKDNEIIFIENDKEVKYKVLLTIESLNNKNYIIYNKNNNKTTCYAKEYTIKDNKYILKNIKTKEEIKLLEGIINSLNKKGENNEN